MLYSYIAIEMSACGMHGRAHKNVASNVITLKQVRMRILCRLEQKVKFN